MRKKSEFLHNFNANKENFEPIEIAWGYHLSFYLSHSPIRDDSIHRG